MVDKELIENWRNMLKPSISSRLLKTNYEGMGEQDKEEFERDFDEILDLALIGLKCKAQLSQEGTTKDATSSTAPSTASSTTDTISRQAAKLKVARVVWEKGDTAEDFNDKCVDCLDDVLPVEAIPVSWIEGEMAEMKSTGETLPYILAELIGAMVRKWREE